MSLWQTILLSSAFGATAGIIAGALSRGIREKRQQAYQKEQLEKMGRGAQRLFKALTRWVYYVLGISLVWTVYFMVLGIADRSESEYAANSSTLIVSVVTVFSIMIAFHEFLHRNDEKKQ